MHWAKVRAGIAGVVLFFALPTSAYAWTDASVQTVRAVVDIDQHGAAHVTLVAKVRVHGGWLTDFEVDGLDPDLTFDGQGAPWAVDEAGIAYAPTVTRVADGRVRVAFDRHNAPRRGICEIGFHYQTILAHRATTPSGEGESIRIRWTLPAWQTGLDGVTLTVSVPGRAEEVYGDDEERDVATVHSTFENGRTTLTYRRVHLPRTTPWTLEIDTPQSAMDASLGRARQVRTEARREELPSWPFRLGIGLVLVVLCVVKERLVARSHLRGRAAVAMNAFLRAFLVIAALTVASLSSRGNHLVPAAAYMLLVVLGATQSDGRARPAERVRSHLGLTAAMDITTALGSLTFAAICVGAFVLSSVHAAQIAEATTLIRLTPLFAWPLYLMATRLHEVDPALEGDMPSQA